MGRSGSIDIRLRFLAALEIAVEAPFEVGNGRRYARFRGATFEGRDGLAGVVAGGGVDWQTVRPDGVIEIDAHDALLTHEGDPIEVRSSGIRKMADPVIRIPEVL
jgi:hypothetical protein